MYIVHWTTTVGKTTNKFFGQEIPATRYKSHDKKVKNTDIKFTINNLLNDKNVESIHFWKYPKKQNKMICVKTISGEIKNRDWKDLL